MITLISQRDARWAKERIGSTNLTIADWGCTICSCSMALEKLRGDFCNPANAARYWNFNARGELIWQTKFNGMHFVWRGYSIDMNKIKEYANDSSKAVVAKVSGYSTPHWVYVDRVHGNKRTDVSIIDPLNGQFYRNLPIKYNIVGYALFEADESFVSAWAKKNWERGLEDGLAINDPQEKCDIMKFQLIAAKAGLKIKQPGSEMTMERAVELIYKWKDEIDRYKELS